MQLISKRHKGLYLFGAFMVVVGVLGLAVLGLRDPSGDPALLHRLEGSRPLVIVVALILIIIGILLRWNVRRMQDQYTV